MDSSGYTTLTRQSGLLNEFQIVAQNIANSQTVGFRREGVIFSEYVKKVEGDTSLSMASGNARNIDLTQAGLTMTNGTYDFAIDGSGFFLVQTPNGDRLTRAGSFTKSSEGFLSTSQGHQVLDSGGSPIVLPTGGGDISVSTDGTISQGGNPISQIGVWEPTNPTSLRREAGALLSADGYEPQEGSFIKQGYLEESNVDPIAEITRMIEVQRAYELGQSFMNAENDRQKDLIQTLGK